MHSGKIDLTIDHHRDELREEVHIGAADELREDHHDHVEQHGDLLVEHDLELFLHRSEELGHLLAGVALMSSKVVLGPVRIVEAHMSLLVDKPLHVFHLFLRVHT